MDWKDRVVMGPVDITLPCGEVITVDGVPYEGWGYEPGVLYRIGQANEDDLFVAERCWIVQR